MFSEAAEALWFKTVISEGIWVTASVKEYPFDRLNLVRRKLFG
jgi:hypothetical protein